jgi:hypothetical protein
MIYTIEELIMHKDWRGLIKIKKIQHLSKTGEVLWEDSNLYNTLHLEGELFILNAVFAGGQDSTFIPDFYYFGLDNRTTIAAADTMASLQNEPSTFGYIRQDVSSLSQFSVALNAGHYRADSPVIAFSAVGGGWGPVRNLFLTDESDDTGSLISSVELSTAPITLSAGEQILLEMGLSLFDVP